MPDYPAPLQQVLADFSAMTDREERSQYLIELAVQVQDDIVFTIFGRSISMGKGQGLMGMVAMVRRLAKQHLDGQQP